MSNDWKTTMDAYQRFPKIWKTLGVRWSNRQCVSDALPACIERTCFKPIVDEKIEEDLSSFWWIVWRKLGGSLGVGNFLGRLLLKRY